MDQGRLYLHDREKLLCEQRASGGALAQSLIRGVMDAIFLAIGFAIALFLIQWLLTGGPWGVWWYGGGGVLAFIIVCVKRAQVWKSSRFRVTSERILLQDPIALWMQPVKTIKWPQYQESHVGAKSFFDYLFFSRPIAIRYGTADAKMEMQYPSLVWAHDLKHYLDKVDSAFRAGQAESVPAFVEAPRGKRDGVTPAVG